MYLHNNITFSVRRKSWERLLQNNPYDALNISIVVGKEIVVKKQSYICKFDSKREN